MDRCRNLVSLTLLFALTGCCASRTFQSHMADFPAGVSCGESCGCTGESSLGQSGLNGGIERGRPNLLLDGAGWIVGIPSKLLLWNTKIDSHSVSEETEQQLRQYLTANGLHDVKVRINQYDPAGEWRRLVENKSIHPGWRYTVGALAVTRYTMLPGRLFGNDEYNPFTNSISLYSDRSTIALREGAHAKSVTEASYRGLYSASMYLPGSPLWIDTYATREVLAHVRESQQSSLERETYLVLFPAYGARVGQSLLFYVDAGQGQVAQAGFSLIGHAVGRTMAAVASENPTDVVKSVYGIVKRPADDQSDVESAQNAVPADEFHPVRFVPLEVTYEPISERL